MGFYKVGSAPIVGVYQSSGKFSKCAAKNEEISEQQDQAVKHAINLISSDILKSLSKVYNISANIDDYIFPIPRAVTANVPNSNGDLFSHEELTRYSPAHRCLVYQTFRTVPLHIEHAASDPKAARGFIPDAHYMTANEDDMHVLTVVAMDTSKDPPLASGMLDGSVNKFSMGCICGAVKCSYCSKIAKSDRDLCECLRQHKMARINGTLVYEACLDVEYQELSVVGDPADERALTQVILQRAASKNVPHSEKFTLLSNLVSKADQKEIARFFKANVGKLPDAMIRLADKIL